MKGILAEPCGLQEELADFRRERSGMKATKSFFKREAIFILLIELAPPVLGLLYFLFILLRRWLAR
jgi:hypothetical protein